MKEFGVPPPPDVITHCRRELYHEVIKLILQGRFVEAYKHGILIKFLDGVTRRVFPRFYCYSADYPEKYVHSHRSDRSLMPLSRVLIANIKNMGQCPCPRCNVKMTEVKDLGTVEDNQRRMDTRKPTGQFFRAVKKAQKAIFKGYKVSGSRVEKLLGGWSRIPTNVSAGVPPPPSGGMLIAGQERLYGLHSWPQCIFTPYCRPTA